MKNLSSLLSFSLFLLIFLINENCYAQKSSCYNADFEQNSFLSWTGKTGICCPINMMATGLVNGRHTIMSGSGTDPYSLGQIPVVAPGGLFSARLGNDDVNSEAEELIYSFPVSTNDELFIYRYAVVLEDPAHDSVEQPRFEIRVHDQSGAPVDCGTYNVVSSANIPGFQNNGTYRFKTWTTVGIELSAYIGQTVTIEFSTGDCSLGAHFGYAYVDCYCSPLQIFDDFCPGDTTTTMSAPPGFASYSWSTGETTSSITVDYPVIGTAYTVSMTSVTGCTVSLTTVLTPAIMGAAFNQTAYCYNNAQFDDSSYVKVGAGITQWHWEFGDGDTSAFQNPAHKYPSEGNYNVTLISTNRSGCSDTITKVIHVDSIPENNFTFTPACPGFPYLFNDLSTFSSGSITSRTWSFGDSTANSILQDPAHVFSNPGTYNVTLVTTASNGCTDTLTKPVTTIVAPVANFGTSTLCIGSTVEFIDSSTFTGGTIVSHTWDFGDSSPTSNVQNPSHTYSTGGSYTVTLAIEGSNGCVDSISRQIILEVLPSASFLVSNQCSDNFTAFTDISTLPSGTITNWNWNFGDGSPNSSDQNPYHVYSLKGNYDVTLAVTGSNGCYDTVKSNILIKQSPVSTFSYIPACPDFPTLFADSSFFPSGSIIAWNWNFDDGTPNIFVQTPSHNYSNPGNYNVMLVVLADNGCYDSVFQSVSTAPSPSANFAVPSGCANTLFAFNDASIISSGSIAAWTWSFGDGSVISAQQNPVHVFAKGGSFIVKLIAVSDNGCVDTIPKEVSVTQIPSAGLSLSTSCIGNPVLFRDNSYVSPGSITSWTWNFGDGSPVDNTQNTSHTYNDTLLYIVSLIVQSSDGCSDTLVKNIKVHPLPLVDFDLNNVCFHDVSKFTSGSIISSGIIKNLLWNFGDSITANGINSPQHLFNSPGNYTIQLIAVSDYNCEDSISKPYEVYELPVADFIPDPLNGCEPQQISFTDQSTSNDGLINKRLWHLGDGTSDTLLNPVHIYMAGKYSVDLWLQTDLGCEDSITYKNLIEVYPLPVAGFIFEPEEPTLLNPIVAFIDQSLGANGWLYDFGDNETSTDQSPLHEFLASGDYTLSQIVNNQYGCKDTVYEFVHVEDAYTLYIPNSFSPNDDGRNDEFSVSGIGIKTFEMFIFNRWGSIIYKTENNQPWNGQYNGSNAKQDSYVYLIKVVDIFNQPHMLRGRVSLVR